MAVELFPHQEKALEFLGNGKILCGGVGSGKSLTAIEYYMRNERPKNIYVITTAKKRNDLEWEGEAVKYGISTDPACTALGTGVIVVDSWNNISKYTEVEDHFFIFDEQRVVGSGAWAKSFQKITQRNRWILLSATPGDTWMDYAQVFIANNLYRNITEFKREHVVYAYNQRYPKIQRYIHTDVLEKYRHMLLVDMPYARTTTRHLEFVDVEYDEDLFKQVNEKRWNPYTDEPVEDVAEMFRLMRRVAYDDPSRLDKVLELHEEHPKMIIFYNFNYELEALRSLGTVLGDDVEIAEYNGHKHQKTPTSDKWIYLVQYTAGSEGWNCVTTDTILYFSLTYSYKAFEQSQGRIDRLDTKFTDLYYYVLYSGSMIDRIVWESLEGKKHFNETAWFKETYGDLYE